MNTSIQGEASHYSIDKTSYARLALGTLNTSRQNQTAAAFRSAHQRLGLGLCWRCAMA